YSPIGYEVRGTLPMGELGFLDEEALGFEVRGVEVRGREVSRFEGFRLLRQATGAAAGSRKA
ncbi:MAG: hypothetical protein RSE59_11085, partial [Clostridia bacterium]